MNWIKHNNELYQCFISENKFDFLYDKKKEGYIGQLELITHPGKINTWLGVKKNNLFDVIWIKITNSFNDEDCNIDFHQHKGFYISVINHQNTLLIQYNDPLSEFTINQIINFFNKIQYIKHFDYVINIVEKIIKRKSDFLDFN